MNAQPPPPPNYSALVERLCLIIEGIMLAILAESGLLAAPVRFLIERQLRRIRAELDAIAAERAEARVLATASPHPNAADATAGSIARMTPCHTTAARIRAFPSSRARPGATIAMNPRPQTTRSFSKRAGEAGFCTP